MEESRNYTNLIGISTIIILIITNETVVNNSLIKMIISALLVILGLAIVVFNIISISKK